MSSTTRHSASCLGLVLLIVALSSGALRTVHVLTAHGDDQSSCCPSHGHSQTHHHGSSPCGHDHSDSEAPPEGEEPADECLTCAFLALAAFESSQAVLLAPLTDVARTVTTPAPRGHTPAPLGVPEARGPPASTA